MRKEYSDVLWLPPCAESRYYMVVMNGLLRPYVRPCRAEFACSPVLQLLKHERALMLLIWNCPPSRLEERTNEGKRRILHLLENHLAVAHHEPDLDLLVETEDRVRDPSRQTAARLRKYAWHIPWCMQISIQSTGNHARWPRTAQLWQVEWAISRCVLISYYKRINNKLLLQ